MKPWLSKTGGVALACAMLAAACGDDEDSPRVVAEGGAAGEEASGGSGGTGNSSALSGGSGGTSTGGSAGEVTTGGETSTGGSGGSAGETSPGGGTAGGEVTAGSAGLAGESAEAGSAGVAGAPPVAGGGGVAGSAAVCPPSRPREWDECDTLDAWCDYGQFVCICTDWGWLCGGDPGFAGAPGQGGAGGAENACPETQPAGNCARAELGLMCDYGDTTCVCTFRDWQCTNGSAGAGGGGGDTAGTMCPQSQPDSGDACSDITLECEYDGSLCLCIPVSAREQQWRCRT